MMLLTCGNCLGLSIVILLTPRDDLFSGPRMESRAASYPCSICQPVGSHNCISQVIYWPHARVTCGTEQVNGYMKRRVQELCTGEPRNATVSKVRCTIFCHVAFANAVYKLSYSASSCLTMAFTTHSYIR